MFGRMPVACEMVLVPLGLLPMCMAKYGGSRLCMWFLKHDVSATLCCSAPLGGGGAERE